MSIDSVKDRVLTSRDKLLFYSDIRELVWRTKFSEERLLSICEEVQEEVCSKMTTEVLRAYHKCPNALLKTNLDLYPAPTRHPAPRIVIGDVSSTVVKEKCTKYHEESKEIYNALLKLNNDIQNVRKLHELMTRFPQFEKFWPQNRVSTVAPVKKVETVVKKAVPSEAASVVYSLLE